MVINQLKCRYERFVFTDVPWFQAAVDLTCPNARFVDLCCTDDEGQGQPRKIWIKQQKQRPVQADGREGGVATQIPGFTTRPEAPGPDHQTALHGPCVPVPLLYHRDHRRHCPGISHTSWCSSTWIGDRGPINAWAVGIHLYALPTVHG